MPVHRLFIIAPALARLIRKERGGERVQEGYFSDQSHRSAFVQVEETRSSLNFEAGDGTFEERADLPLAHAHAQALLAVSQGSRPSTCAPALDWGPEILECAPQL